MLAAMFCPEEHMPANTHQCIFISKILSIFTRRFSLNYHFI